MGDKMKKIIFYFLIILIIPTIIALRIEEEKKSEIKLVQNDFVRVKREEKDIIEKVNLEDYVIGVVSGEMPISFLEEALKAQAVCARSYVLRKMEQNKEKEYDVVDTINNQVYQDNEELKEKWGNNYEKNYQKLKKIVEETKGEYLIYQGEIIETFFFSTSNGHTENSEEVFSKALPYLRSVESTWDEEVSPVFNSKTEMSLSDFYTKLNLPYQKDLTYEVLETTESGSVKKIKINGVEYKGTTVRSKLALRSTFFEFNVNGSNIEIMTKGYGHGVGMSQYGALAMAKKGYNYEKILKYYYQGVEISKID